MNRKIWFSLLSAVLMLALVFSSVAAFADDEPAELTEFDRALNAAGSALTFDNDEEHPWEVVEVDGRTAVKTTIEGIANAESAFYWYAGNLPLGSVLKFSWKLESETGSMGNFCTESNCFNYLFDSSDWEDVVFTISHEEDFLFHWMIQTGDTAGNNVLYVDDIVLYIPNDLGDALNVEGGMLTFENDEEHPWEVVEVDGRTAVKTTIEGMANTESALYWYAGNLPLGSVLKFSWKLESETGSMGNFCTESNCFNYLFDSSDWEDIEFKVTHEEDFLFHWMIQTGDTAGNNVLYLDDISILMPYNASDDPELPVILGDLNGNDILDTGDATMVLQHLVGLTTLSDEVLETVADANQDGVVNSGDAAFILRTIVNG